MRAEARSKCQTDQPPMSVVYVVTLPKASISSAPNAVSCNQCRIDKTPKVPPTQVLHIPLQCKTPSHYFCFSKLCKLTSSKYLPLFAIRSLCVPDSTTFPPSNT